MASNKEVCRTTRTKLSNREIRKQEDECDGRHENQIGNVVEKKKMYILISFIN